MTPHRVRTWPHSGGGHCTKCGAPILPGELITTWCENPGEAERIGHVCPGCDARAEKNLRRKVRR